MWSNDGATSNPNGDSEARKSDQECKEKRKDWKKNFFNSLLTEGIRCGPTRELRLNPTRILKQRNLIRDADITRQIFCEKVKKTNWRFFNSLLTEGIGCGPTRELRLKPTRILKQGNLIKDTQKTKKKCEQIAKKLLDFLAHHGCVGFQEKQ